MNPHYVSQIPFFIDYLLQNVRLTTDLHLSHYKICIDVVFAVQIRKAAGTVLKIGLAVYWRKHKKIDSF